jgi:hypothetical protein
MGSVEQASLRLAQLEGGGAAARVLLVKAPPPVAAGGGGDVELGGLAASSASVTGLASDLTRTSKSGPS